MSDLISKLRTLKKAYEEDLITNDEYKSTRQKILDDWSELKKYYLLYI